tara:strand:+ start:3005 stop:3244 length:240 start_codon:yes stop_codon:yes gene_type:complete
MKETMSVVIEINSMDFDCEVEFYYHAEEKATWECAGEAELFEITKITYTDDGTVHDISGICAIEAIHDSIMSEMGNDDV